MVPLNGLSWNNNGEKRRQEKQSLITGLRYNSLRIECHTFFLIVNTKMVVGPGGNFVHSKASLNYSKQSADWLSYILTDSEKTSQKLTKTFRWKSKWICRISAAQGRKYVSHVGELIHKLAQMFVFYSLLHHTQAKPPPRVSLHSSLFGCTSRALSLVLFVCLF